MPGSGLLRKHWHQLSRTALDAVLREAEHSVEAFVSATQAHGSLLQSWIRGIPMLEFDHYPAEDIVDLRTGSQFYYHSHRQDGLEHGHLHLFWHATASGRRRRPRGGRMRWSRTAPTHLFAISLDGRGLPVALFTVNRWVTDGHWFDAKSTVRLVERFHIADGAGHALSCEWLNGFVRFYRPVIAELMCRRDRRLARSGDVGAPLRDKRLEVLSTIRIDWMADLEALQRYSARRSSTRRASSPN